MAPIYINWLCNPDIDGPLWSDNVTERADGLRLPLCFQYTVLRNIPSIYWLLFTLPFYLTYLLRLPRSSFSRGSWLNVFKLVFCLLLAIFALIDVFGTLVWSGGHGAVFFIGALLDLAAFVGICVVIKLEYMCSINSSGYVFVFWLLQSISKLVLFFSVVAPAESSHEEANSGANLDNLRRALLYLGLAGVLIELGLHCFADNTCLMHAQLFGPAPAEGDSLSRLSPSTSTSTSASSNGFVNPLASESGRESEKFSNGAAAANGAESSLLRSTKSAPAQQDDISSATPIFSLKRACPELLSPFISRVTFAWFTKLLWLGYRRPLKESDFWELRPWDVSAELVPRLERCWNQELNNALRRQRIINYTLEGDVAHDYQGRGRAAHEGELQELSAIDGKRGEAERTKLFNANGKGNGSGSMAGVWGLGTGDNPLYELRNLYARAEEFAHTSASGSQGTLAKPSVLITLMRLIGFEFFLCGLFKLIYDCMTFGTPLLLDKVIQVLSGEDPIQWHGYVYMLAILALLLTRLLIFNQYFYYGYVVGMHLKTALIGFIYRKAMRLSSAGRKDATVGEIVNLMSADIQRLMDGPAFIQLVWSGPFVILVSLILLWQKIGWAALAGMAIMIALIPFNTVLMHRMRNQMVIQMRLKDERLKLSTEVLSGIKVLKLYGWETSFREKIDQIREREIKALRRATYYTAGVTISWFIAPFLVAATMFAVYIVSSPSHVLDAKTAFVSLNLINILSFPMSVLPNVLTMGLQMLVSFKRMRDYFLRDEVSPEAIEYSARPSDVPVKVEGGTFAWDKQSKLPPQLNDINISVRRGSLVAIVGQVGSGKSSLLSAILGEMHKLSGGVSINGSVAYVPQQAWLLNTTLRQNVVFIRGSGENKGDYQRVISACALEPDIAVLPAGDETEIGERGINLSGGQKQRVSLARAAYLDADLYLLDDPLSAVDAHVSKHIFERLIGNTGLLAHKTRVLVTHAVHLLPKVDQIIVMKEGRVVETGSFVELMAHDGSFADYCREYLEREAAEQDETSPEDEGEEEHPPAEHTDDPVATLAVSTRAKSPAAHASLAEDPDTAQFKASLKRQLSRKASTSAHDAGAGGALREDAQSRASRKSQGVVPSIGGRKRERSEGEGLRGKSPGPNRRGSKQPPGNGVGAEKKEGGKARLIGEEGLQEGSVKWSVYMAYFRAVGLPLCCAVLVTFSLYAATNVTTNYWLSAWSDDAQCPRFPDLSANFSANVSIPECGLPTAVRVIVYVLLGAVQAVVILIQSLIIAYAMCHGAEVIHKKVIARIVRSPMSFFETTPLGRITNRLSKDVDSTDVNIPQSLRLLILMFANILASFLVVMLSGWQVFPVLIAMAIYFVLVQRMYIATSRHLKRIESVLRSPIYSHFQCSLVGVASIRAFRMQTKFVGHNDSLVDRNQKSYFPQIVSFRWLGIWLDLVCTFAIFLIGMIAVLRKDDITPGLGGLALTYALQITNMLGMFLRNMCDLENNVVAVERLQEYSELNSEASLESNVALRMPWPSQGRVEFINYSCRYRPGLELILKGINCNIMPAEKVGIVGRTGAGKSSLSVALFRIVEAAEGRILVDGVDISHVGLQDLRSSLTIIPQDPVLFSGTLRVNLDPTSVHADKDIWSALEQVNLREVVAGLPDQLEHVCSEGGENLSVGQRQLVCLARALLRCSKVLVLDEATAAVDLETDEAIQRTIRTQFIQCTVLTIAHRLNTVLDYNRIMVLEQGRISEFDSPNALLQNRNSLFYSMAKDAGLV